jgi:hypothetical protein
MSYLVAVLGKIRAMKKVRPDLPAKETLRGGLTVELLADGIWHLTRIGVTPSDQEVSIIARDAKLEIGWTVEDFKDDANVFLRVITPKNNTPPSSLAVQPASRTIKIVQPRSVDTMRNYVFEAVTAHFGYKLEDGKPVGKIFHAVPETTVFYGGV